MTRTLLFAATLALAPAASDSASKPAPLPPPATIAELEARIRKVLDSTKTPGMSLAMVRHDSVIFLGAFGRSRVSPERAATAATLFRIGSTSKAFVALTALALEREGKLSLHDPIRKYLPGFYYVNPWEATDTVRIINLLEHTSGFDDNSIMSYANNDPTPLTLSQGLAIDSLTRHSRWRPGTRFSYCNTGPAIVALIIEKIEGKPFEQVVQERWFTPIGMNSATYMRPDSTHFDAVTLYRGDGKTPYPYWNVFIRPAGAINASATDMAAYVRFLLGRGTVNGVTLLPRESIERMERPETSIGARAGLGVGYGKHMYSIADTLGFVWMGHNGGVEGGISDLSYLPEHGVGYSWVISSADPVAVDELARLVRGYLTQGLTPRAEPPRATVPSTVQREFSGWYRDVSPRTQHLYFLDRLASISRVTINDTGLRLAPVIGTVIRYVPMDSMRFRRKGQTVATLVLVRDGVNDRPQGIEEFGGALGSSSAKISGFEAGLEIALTTGWLAGLVLTLLVTLFGILRWLVRLIRRRPRRAAPAAPLWVTSLLAVVFLFVNVACLQVASSDLQAFGNLSLLSAMIFVAGILFALESVVGLVFLIRRREAPSVWAKLSIGVARIVLVLNFIVAAYLTYWGYIGWRTWA